MKNLAINYLQTLICCSIVLFGFAACIPNASTGEGLQQPIATVPSTDLAEISTSDPITPTTVPVEETKAPSITLSVPTPTLQGETLITTSVGVSFQYPSDWQLIDSQQDANPKPWPFSYLLRSPTEGVVSQIIIFSDFLPKEQEPTLYLHAGHAFGDFFDTHVVWDKSSMIRDNEWHMRIHGISGGKFWDGLDALEAKGAITRGTITVVHYEKEKEFFVMLSRELDREMLIALDAQGADAMITDHLQQFMEILNSVTFTQ